MASRERKRVWPRTKYRDPRCKSHSRCGVEVYRLIGTIGQYEQRSGETNRRAFDPLALLILGQQIVGLGDDLCVDLDQHLPEDLLQLVRAVPIM